MGTLGRVDVGTLGWECCGHPGVGVLVQGLCLCEALLDHQGQKGLLIPTHRLGELRQGKAWVSGKTPLRCKQASGL